MILKLRILFVCLAIAKIVMPSYLPVEEDKTKIQIPLKTNSLFANNSIDTGKRVKRFAPLLLGAISGVLSAAAATPIGVAITENYRASSSNECSVTIRYRETIRRYSKTALNMNFKSTWDNNWNYEKISNEDSFDSTKEKVSGGRLKLIQNYPEGKFCVEGIIYSCGSELNKRNTERSVILDVSTIRKAWFIKGNPRMLEVNWGRNCIWFSDKDYKSVRAIDIYPEAFTECENSDEDCISKHIEVF